MIIHDIQQIVASSGFGTEYFELLENSDGRSARLMVAKPLDYEDPRQTNGFRFKLLASER